MSRRRFLFAAAALGVQGCVAPAVPARDVSTGSSANASAHPSAYRFERFELDSRDGKRHNRVELAIPGVAAPAGGFPLLVMLDGNAAFAALDRAELGRLAEAGRPLAVATLGYRTEGDVDLVARAYDYTPPVPGQDPTWESARHKRLGGGADVFLDLYADRIRGEIARRVPTDAARSTLWGHSYGGLLALHALFTRPQLFARYATADASLWWHDGYILQAAQRAVALPAGRETGLLMMVGSSWLEAPSAGAASRRSEDPRLAVPPDSAQRLADELARRPGLSVSWRTFPGVGHGPLRAQSIAPTLQFATR
ncbi:alpha/beta hydrolase [Uliginosibacterium sp. H1]|uniref:alpha/beta hydrolase n=1 Tax=Uliginosibacterium sp. H1 TaxID=3114757 RepID=UPI002E17E21F|nr:alpha/beta hydrolase-fold protein [Uliginosibacterium sp. H1]